MKLTFNFIFRQMTLIFLIGAVFACLPLFAQTNTESQPTEIPSLMKEEFQKATDLIVPWRESGCQDYYNAVQEPNCHKVTREEYKNSTTLSIYNSDSSLWYRFSVDYHNPQFHQRIKKAEFLPFAFYLDHPMLRMIGESEHWYEVEINEKTRATKFVLKTDPMWAKTTWHYWLIKMRYLGFIGEKQKLLDKPEGNVIEESANLDYVNIRFLKAQGDWIYVEGLSPEPYRGWIRWRSGRDLLLKSWHKTQHPFIFTANQKDLSEN